MRTATGHFAITNLLCPRRAVHPGSTHRQAPRQARRQYTQAAHPGRHPGSTPRQAPSSNLRFVYGRFPGTHFSMEQNSA